MKNLKFIIILSIISATAFAETWTDNFSGQVLGAQWKGDRDNFSLSDGSLQGRNAHPILLLPLRFVEVGENLKDYNVECQINVVTPNLLECTKGAIILRHKGNDGYVFALHIATKTIEVYRLSDGEMLLSKEEPLELEKWYKMKAELDGENMSFYLDEKLVGKIKDDRSLSGPVGLAVQDALNVLFDDFSITGDRIDIDPSLIKFKCKLSTTWSRIKI